MILRIFKVEIFPEMRSEFERDFASISVRTVMSQAGCLSCQLGFPIKATSNIYVLLTLWRNLESLIAFTGENFEESFIPAGMGRYVKSCFVEHYLSAEPDRRHDPN